MADLSLEPLGPPGVLLVAGDPLGIDREVVGQPSQPRDPLVEPCHHPRGATRPLPRRHGSETVVESSHRRIGQPGGDVATTEVVIGECEQRQERPAEQRRVGRAHRSPEPRDPCTVERVGHQPCVRVGGAVDDRAAAQRDTLPGGCDDLPDRVADLLVGVGHTDRPVGDRGRRLGLRPDRADALDRGPHRRVGVVGTGAAGENLEGVPATELGDEIDLAGREPLGKEQDRRPELVQNRGAFPQGDDRRRDEVLLVGEPALELAADRPVDPYHVRSA